MQRIKGGMSKMEKSHVLIITTVLLTTIFIVGCTGQEPNYYTSHRSVSAPYNISIDGCGLYYENITILDKTTEIVSEVFSSRTSYVIVANDGIFREATSFEIYRQFEPNKTYTVISTDRQGCGYSNHHVWVGSVVIP